MSFSPACCPATCHLHEPLPYLPEIYIVCDVPLDKPAAPIVECRGAHLIDLNRQHCALSSVCPTRLWALDSSNQRPVEKEAPAMADSVVDLTKTYDAVVIGSGAAGGMACHVLTSHGAKALLLEAGTKPYNNKYRGLNPPDYHSLNYNEYTSRRPPYGPGFESAKHLKSYIGSDDYVKNITVDERENPSTGTNYAWVRACSPG